MACSVKKSEENKLKVLWGGKYFRQNFYALEYLFILDILSNKCFDLTEIIRNVLYNLGDRNVLCFLWM